MIFLDMDGVLCDFAGGVCALFGKDAPQAGDLAQELHQHLGIAKGLMWSRIAEAGARLWEGLEPLPWADELVALVRSHGELVIATAPSLNPASLAGKLTWLQRRFGRNFRDFVVTPQKHLLAAPGRILIDDSPRHVDAFSAFGGLSTLFPSIENGLLRPDQDPVMDLRNWLKQTDRPAAE